MPGGNRGPLAMCASTWPMVRRLGPRTSQGVARSGDFRDGPVAYPARSATLTVVSTFSASAALPYDDLDRATGSLRDELRHALASVDEVPDWSTLEVKGPTEVKGASGRTWYRWTATVESQRPLDSAATVTRPGSVQTESGSTPAHVPPS